MKTLIVEESENGLRLDELLFKRGIYLSRSQANLAVHEGKVLVGQKNKKAGYMCRTGEIISYEEKTSQPLNLKPEAIPLSIVYEDEDILVINKQRGLIVHPGNGNYEHTLVNALLFHYQNLPLNNDDPARPGIVHRIDKETTGLLVVAKKEEALRALSKQLIGHQMKRHYLCLTHGIPTSLKGTIIAPLGRDPHNPLKQAVVSNGKEAITDFRLLKKYGKHALLDVNLRTGRTHQIRVHLNYLNLPIEGDLLYGKNNHDLFNKGQLLHAYRLELKHPRSGEIMNFYAPLPEDFLSVLASLRVS